MDRYRNEEMKALFPVLWRKLDILCKGIIDNDIMRDLYDKQNPHETKRTGNNGIQIKLGKEKIPLNVAVQKAFCSRSPYRLERDQKGNYYLFHTEENATIPVSCPQEAPWWYKESILTEEDDRISDASSAKVVGDLVVLEGDSTAIASISRGCCYFKNNEACKFCALESKKSQDAVGMTEDPKRKAKLMKALSIMAHDQRITNFHLTGGNLYSSDRGLLRYIPFVEQIRRFRPDARIAVEFTPPEQEYQKVIFEQLKAVGVDSITMNIEFWNDEERVKYMPYKGRIPKEDYLSAFEYGLEVFGPNKVTCGFIIGLEPLADSLEGIQAVTEHGIIAEVYPYKPNDGSEMAEMDSYQITRTEVIMEASLFANECMRANGIRPDLCSGCVKCGACGITQELHSMNSIQNNNI